MRISVHLVEKVSALVSVNYLGTVALAQMSTLAPCLSDTQCTELCSDADLGDAYEGSVSNGR